MYSLMPHHYVFIYLVSGRESIKRTRLIGLECVWNILIAFHQTFFFVTFPD